MTVLSVVLPFKCSTTSSESGIRKLASPYYTGLTKDRNPESGISSRWSNPKPMHACGQSGIRNLEFRLVEPKTGALVGTADVLAAAQTRPMRDSAIAVARDRYHRRRREPSTARLPRLVGRDGVRAALIGRASARTGSRSQPASEFPDSGFRSAASHVLGTLSVKVVLHQIPERPFHAQVVHV